MRYDNEIWKDIKDYEGLYQVSNLGRVRSIDRMCKSNKNNIRIAKGKVLAQKTDKRGYKRVELSKNGKHKTFTVHRLVLSTFVENKSKFPCINHKDENPSNNVLDNLEWCTQKYNVNYGTGIERMKNKIDYKAIGEKQGRKVIDITNNIIYSSIHEAGRITNINFQNIYKCCNGKRLSAGGIKWRYADAVEIQG